MGMNVLDQPNTSAQNTIRELRSIDAASMTYRLHTTDKCMTERKFSFLNNIFWALTHLDHSLTDSTLFWKSSRLQKINLDCSGSAPAWRKLDILTIFE